MLLKEEKANVLACNTYITIIASNYRSHQDSSLLAHISKNRIKISVYLFIIDVLLVKANNVIKSLILIFSILIVKFEMLL